MIGSHLSVAGGLHHALTEARSLDMTCVQIFTKNQRQWSAPPLTGEQIKRWNEHRKSTGVERVVSHDSYLINLAAVNPDTLEKSIALFRDELERCEALSIPYLVSHPGAHMKAGEDLGLAAVAKALDQIHKDLPGYKTVTCLEITAGQGTSLGHRFEHLKKIIDLVKEPDRLGVCFDTAHLIESGYDLTSAAGMKATLEEAEAVIGLDRLKVWHVNDSKTTRGSRVDRHAHIGRGHVSLDAFAVIMKDKRFKSMPMILETPKEDAPDGRAWDTVNMQTLLELADSRKKTPKK